MQRAEGGPSPKTICTPSLYSVQHAASGNIWRKRSCSRFLHALRHASGTSPFLHDWRSTEDYAAAATPYGNGSCQRRCGDLDIPYPFGIGRGCYHYTGEGDITFGLTCNRTGDGGYQAFCWEVEVIGISVRHGQARIRNDIRAWCYNRSSRSMGDNSLRWVDFSDSQFRLSDEANRFTVVGCSSLAYVQSVNTGTEYMTGCMATCPDAARLENGSCAGMGCCQAAIPRGINTYGVQFDDRFNTSAVTGFSPCSYAVLMEAAAFDFRATYVTTGDFVESTGGKVPVVLDWVVGKETCGEATRNATAYMCVSSNSVCVDSRNGPGYLCNCSAGYEGNPRTSLTAAKILTSARTLSTLALFLEHVPTLQEGSSVLAPTRPQATLTTAHARPRNLSLGCAWQLVSASAWLCSWSPRRAPT